MTVRKPCPRCRENGRDSTGDHLFLMQDEKTWHCTRCKYTERDGEVMDELKKTSSRLTIEEVQELPSADVPTRALRADTLERYGVKVGFDESTGEVRHLFFPRYSDGELVGYKQKDLAHKKFFPVGNMKNSDFFGQHLYGDGGKFIIVTEGEEDALAASQMLADRGKSYRVISLPDGAKTNTLKNNQSAHEWLESFEKVVVAFDQDEEGQAAAARWSKLLSPGKIRIMKFSEKDANTLLLEGKEDEFWKSLQSAKPIKVTGVVSSGSTWDLISSREVVTSIPYPEDWKELNEMTYGIRTGELDTWTSGSGMGKTQVLRELQYHLLKNTEDNIGIMALEEPLHDTVEALMSLELERRFHLPDVRETVSDDEAYNAWLATAGTNRLHMYDHWGSEDEESLLYYIRYMAQALECKYIFLDHLSIAVSEYANEGDERKNIDSLMSKLKRLTQELDIWLGLVVHLRKTSGGGSFEEGEVPSLDDLRGSGSIKQLSNNVYALARNQQAPSDEERNTSSLHVLKCRFTGATGEGGKLVFDAGTGRMRRPPENAHF